IYFYMVTCYEDEFSEWANNATASYVFDGNKYPGIKSWYLTMLMRWSKLDPIDDVEIARNNAIAASDMQNNRNPFVDYPG
ncbi:MAG: endonuclease, partial [Prevotella sp.]|nr:endonuclease [Prevotella sp.]